MYLILDHGIIHCLDQYISSFTVKPPTVSGYPLNLMLLELVCKCILLWISMD